MPDEFMRGTAMALNIVFGGALGNITASQVLAIPDGQLKTDVRTLSSLHSYTHCNSISAVSILMRPRKPSHPGKSPHPFFK